MIDLDFKFEDWLPMEWVKGPPLPRFLEIYWPWYIPPGVTISGLIVAPGEVQIGTSVNISCVAYNATSEAASRVVECKVDGETMATQEVTLQPGESTTIFFSVVPIVAKTYSVSVDGLSGTFKATEEAPPGVADIRVHYLTIEPTEALVGEVVNISVQVTNYGTATGSKRISCEVV